MLHDERVPRELQGVKFCPECKAWLSKIKFIRRGRGRKIEDVCNECGKDVDMKYDRISITIPQGGKAELAKQAARYEMNMSRYLYLVGKQGFIEALPERKEGAES